MHVDLFPTETDLSNAKNYSMVYQYQLIASKKKSEITKTNNLIIYLMALGKQEQSKPESSRWIEMMKIRSEINEMEMEKI